MEITKICTKCKKGKPLSEYNKSTKTCVATHRGDCKECQRAYNNNHYLLNKQHYTDNQRLRRYKAKLKKNGK